MYRRSWPNRTMRPHVGEEMSRQPSLPSLTTPREPGADLASDASEQTTAFLPTSSPGPRRAPAPHHPHTDQRLQRSHPQSHLTRPRSFTDADLYALTLDLERRYGATFCTAALSSDRHLWARERPRPHRLILWIATSRRHVRLIGSGVVRVCQNPHAIAARSSGLFG
jgi:hypothetical protein